MKEMLRRMLGRLLLRLPHNQRRWDMYMRMHMPILAPALKNSPYARLLTLRILDSIHASKPSAAAIRRLNKLHFYCSIEDLPDRAMYNFICGMYAALVGNSKDMARRFRLATKYGHTYHLIHAMLGHYYLTDHRDYARSFKHFSKAIDCVYAYHNAADIPGGTVSTLYANLASAQVMMHNYDDASNSLRLSEQVQEQNSHLLSSRALYHAALRHPTETQRFLSRLEEVNADAAVQLRKQTDLILAEKHPHFTVLPTGTPDAIRAFWQHFLANEDEIMQLLRNDRRVDARALIAGPLNEIDPYDTDIWGFSLFLDQDKYTISIAANYSRTYTPLVDVLFAACPPELHERWHITRNP